MEMNEESSKIGVNAGRVEAGILGTQAAATSLDQVQYSYSTDSSPVLSAITQVYSIASTIRSLSEKHKSPVNLTLCTIALFVIAGCWLMAGYFIKDLLSVYPAPSMLAYVSITCLQFYFFLIPTQASFPKRRLDGTIIITEEDLGNDTYTNRETFKFAFYLFLLFSLAIGLIIKGVSLFPQSSYCGSIGMLGIFAVICLLVAFRHLETFTRYKMSAILLMAGAGALTIIEPALAHKFRWASYLNIGVGLSGLGIIFLALFFVLLQWATEHTHMKKLLVLAFIGFFCMLILWIPLIPLHLFKLERLAFPPPQEDVYLQICGIAFLGMLVPFYLIQWVLTRTSVIYVTVGLGAIIPLHGIAVAVTQLEWNWIDFGASILAAAAIIIANVKFKI